MHGAPGATERKSIRKFIICAAIAFVIGGHLLDLAIDREHWPFTPYPMYSYPPPDQMVAYRLAGVVDGDSPAEFPLLQRRFLRPLDSITLGAALARLNKQPDRQRLLDRAARECLVRYESLRLAHRHDGPPLRGARVYRLTWDGTSSARTGEQPDRRELLHQVMLHDGN